MGKPEKRRKLTSVSTASEVSKPVDVDVYQKVVDFEEAEAKQRPAEKDASLFYKTCEEIRNLMGDIAELKTHQTKEAKKEIAEKRIHATLLIVALKKLNRLEKVRTKAGRDALHKEKQRLDSTHLLLQNLLYETEHLDKEVTKCLQFKSKDEEIDLVSVEEFYSNAPEEVTRPEITKKDEHQLRLSRLEWELRQRRELSEACKSLRESARSATSGLSGARARLEALGPRLREALAAAMPLREALGLGPNSGGMQAPPRAATLLPPPLFLLHARAQAYAEAFGHHLIQVSISGDEDEALRLEQMEETSALNDSDSDLDADLKEDEETQDKKKRHHRGAAKVTKQERAEEKIKLVTGTHPLVVHLVVKLKEASLTLSFYYLLKLKFVTVQSSIDIAKQPGISSAEVLNSHSILHGLYPDDYGTDSPHPATSYILRSAGVEGSFSQFIPRLGQPYIWAQRMCGLDFLATSVTDSGEKIVKTPNKPCPNLSSASVENVLIFLQKRLKARISLMKELQDLESGNIPPFEGTGSCPVRLLGSLTQWQSISWAEYNQAASTGQFISSGFVSQDDMLYRAIITRQSAKLVALVSLKSDYPKSAPIFSLTLHWNGTHHAKTSDDIRDIERCVNTHWCDSGSNVTRKVTLAGQLTRLLACLDILLEAMGSSEFPPDKVMFRPVKGRNRIKPYKYLKQGSGVFTQY